MRARRILKFAIGGLVAFTVAIGLFGWIVHSLWNWLMPAVFHLPMLTFWQAVALLVLSWILFGGLRGARGGRRCGWGMHDRWNRMTPEEREKFREFMRSGARFSGEAEARS